MDWVFCGSPRGVTDDSTPTHVEWTWWVGVRVEPGDRCCSRS
ncbi:MAG: hypothetical protein J07HX64_00963 [halophilic archaeon J07HX64]|nr:MAG: hypothetical protein J07HX64_00963 [halophilic archaeon J07HX64]